MVGGVTSGGGACQASKGCIPISLVLTASGRLNSVTNFFASSRTSMTLLRRANTGASGKEATKRVTKPNWMTRRDHAGTHQQGTVGVKVISTPWSLVRSIRFLPACTLDFLLTTAARARAATRSQSSRLGTAAGRIKRCMMGTPPFHHCKLIICG